jgi:hypothetical protein
MGVSGLASSYRPKITYEDREFRHNGIRTRVVLRRNLVSIGCSDVTPEALRQLLKEYERVFGAEDDYVLQS